MPEDWRKIPNHKAKCFHVLNFLHMAKANKLCPTIFVLITTKRASITIK